MKEKIDIAAILKDCPSGMELDCVMYDNVSFDKVSYDKKTVYPILCYITDENGNRSSISFTENGYESKRYGAKCVIFPKGKTTWEGFQRPFKDGDVVATKNGLFIGIIKIENGIQKHAYVAINRVNSISTNILYCFDRFATEEEKKKLLDVIKDNGYEWNNETKTLEELIIPKFKIGDRIKEKQSGICGEIIDVQNNKYDVKIDNKGLCVYFKEQDDWELLPNKFNINTLEPFDKVLVRDEDNVFWHVQFFDRYDKKLNYPFICLNGIYKQCIPYKHNEHLRGTTNSCTDYYKTW